jgi:molybdopterin-guanine dinucleotide biosynthesis protein A
LRGALVIAGGRNRRFGENKAFAKLAGEPLLLHVLDKAVSVADEVVVAIGREDNAASYSELVPKSIRILNDKMEAKSPLVGIMTGFEEMRSQYAVVLSCDTPFVRPEILKLLFEKAAGSDAAIPMWPNQEIEPLQSVYKCKPAFDGAKIALTEGGFRNVDMIKRLAKVTYVPVEEIKRFDHDLVTFFNVNTRADLQRAEEMYDSVR